jgi:hypothetical protein
VTLGYEPQWLLIKRVDIDGTGDWNLIDNMRGFVAITTNFVLDAELNPNLNASESTGTFVAPTATGFQLETADGGYNASDGIYIYIAIRRGPMKTPTSGTSVFDPETYTEIVPTQTLTSGWPADLSVHARRNSTFGFYWTDRLRGSIAGGSQYLPSSSASTEINIGLAPLLFDNSTGLTITNGGGFNNTAGTTDIVYQFRRAPGFFDVVCYRGTGSVLTLSHNLGVVPELMIIKGRNIARSWSVYSAAVGNTKYQVLNSTATPVTDSTAWNNTTPTASVFTLGTNSDVNQDSARFYVAYLFATVAGVSKVGSYTGTGTTQQINCGFTGGSRFVLIKRTDSTGDWYVWDSARGIVAGNDPYLLLNSTDVEVTNTDYVDTFAAGFEISSTAPAAINANGGTFIFLAIA